MRSNKGIKSAQLQAAAAGQTTFMLSAPCKRGHLAPRYTSNGGCSACMNPRSETLATPSLHIYTLNLRIPEHGKFVMNADVLASLTVALEKAIPALLDKFAEKQPGDVLEALEVKRQQRIEQSRQEEREYAIRVAEELGPFQYRNYYAILKNNGSIDMSLWPEPAKGKVLSPETIAKLAEFDRVNGISQEATASPAADQPVQSETSIPERAFETDDQYNWDT